MMSAANTQEQQALRRVGEDLLRGDALKIYYARIRRSDK
jgi:hypothetical protein